MIYYIYCVTNKLNNKSYVGQSINFNERWAKHIWDAKRKSGKTSSSKKFAFQNAIAKYGKDNFIWQIIDQCETLKKANELEEFYISYLMTLAPNGYNLSSGGNNKKLLKSTKSKISKTLKRTSFFVGKKGSAHPNFKRVFSEQEKNNLSKIFSGEKSSGKKINSQLARSIYLDYLNNIHITSSQLSLKYKIKKVAILNILNKKSWKEATCDLPNLNIKNRTCGENWIKSKLKEKDVIDIIIKYKSGNYTMQQLADEYNLSGSSVISNIVNRKKWKHIIIC